VLICVHSWLIHFPPSANSFANAPTTAFASPNSINVLSCVYSSLSIPANPGFIVRLIAIESDSQHDALFARWRIRRACRILRTCARYAENHNVPQLPREIDLYHQPSDTNFLAHIVPLTSHLVAAGMGPAWWDDPVIALDIFDPPVDIQWPWADAVSDYEAGRYSFHTHFVAVVMGEDEVQGAMIVVGDPRPSTSNPARNTAFIEAIATAPRNRPDLRIDRGEWLLGVGLALLEWAVDLSLELGCQGRIELCASPNGVSWYRKRGFAVLAVAKKNYGAIQYTPMELTSQAAAAFKRSLSERR
jgi:hypothetical protein